MVLFWRNLDSESERIGVDALDSRVDVAGEQKELRQLAQAIHDLPDRACRAGMQVVSDASHELRTPIAVIQGYASLLDRWGEIGPGGPAGVHRRHPHGIQVHAAPGGAAALPGKGGQRLPAVQPGTPGPDSPGRRGPAGGGDDLPGAALLPSLECAVRYSPPEGRVWLRISADGAYARTSIQDEGIGIPPESLPHIFERFYSSDLSRTRRTGGTGLGLAIARWIVDRHGGWFEVISREGVGTRITSPFSSPKAASLSECRPFLSRMVLILCCKSTCYHGKPIQA